MPAVSGGGEYRPPRALTPVAGRRRYVAVAGLNDVERAGRLRLAELWGCSLAEVVRRSIRDALRVEALISAELEGSAVLAGSGARGAGSGGSG